MSTVLRRAEITPSGLSDEEYVALLGADGAELEALCALADTLRADRVGHVVTYVINRNFDTAVVGRTDTASRSELDRLVDEAWALGATEICLQGPVPAEVAGDGYWSLISAITERAPQLHLHAFRPTEIADGARRATVGVQEFLVEAKTRGLGSVPGTAAWILDDKVRTALHGAPVQPVREWIEVITAAHRVGLTSTATMVYGHIENAVQQVAHLRTIADIQADTGGFTEFIAIPYRPVDGSVAEVVRNTRAITAVARLLLHLRIDHIQAPWPKLPDKLTEALLRGGADDIGGLLLNGRLNPAAGQEAAQQLTIEEVDTFARRLGRQPRQRTTRYGQPTAERLDAARRGPDDAVRP